MSIRLFSFPFLFPGYFVLLMLVLSVLLLEAVINLPPWFYIIFLSLYRCIDTILNDSEFSCFFFSWRDVRPCASSWVLLFSVPFVEVLSSTLRTVPSILRGVEPRYLSLWWDCCYVVWFQIVFSFSLGVFFFFISTSLMVSDSNIPKSL